LPLRGETPASLECGITNYELRINPCGFARIFFFVWFRLRLVSFVLNYSSSENYARKAQCCRFAVKEACRAAI
jgi:hypothetical protein